MERLAELISKLKEQFEQKADTAKLLGITLLIERELMKVNASSKVEVAGVAPSNTSKVSVVMPSPRNGFRQAAEEEIQIVDEKPAVVSQQAPPAPPPPAVVVVPEPVASVVETPEAAPVPREVYQETVQTKPAAQQQGRQEFLFDPMQEIPTLAQQKNVKEINELIGLRDPSLNDKLKEAKVEIGHTLTDHPIRDLKKAIGINDRQIFINELFRGDEVMYERSLKTINSFKIYAEAEYWMERELKVKLGWEEHRDTTKHFLHLIKRRFA